MADIQRFDRAEVDWAHWSEDPYPLYARLRDESPVHFDAPNGSFVVTRYADCWALTTDMARFSNVPPHVVDEPAARISPLREEDPPRHGFLRRIVMPMFTPGEMRRLKPYFEELARELLDTAEATGGHVVEVSSQIAVPLPGRVTCDLLGVPLEQHVAFLELTNERQAQLGASSGWMADGGLRTMADIRADLWEIVGPVVQQRRTNPKHDAMTLLIQAQDEHGRDNISDDLIVDMLLHLLTGGFHTTQLLIELLVSELADRPDLWERMRADRSLVLPVIEEMLRYEAPVQAVRRRATETVELRGVEIPGGAEVSLVLGAANRDERVFADPDQFSIDRDNKRQMAFSAGLHYCPGAPVTRFEVQALVDEMLDRYEAIERAGPSVRRIYPQKTAESLRGLESVPVRLIRAS